MSAWEFDTRGFAAWLLARPDGWQIKAAALPHLLKCSSGHVGRDKARRFFRELEHAGYLTRTRRQGADGRWIWDYFFRPTSPAPTIDSSPVGGLPVGALSVDGAALEVRCHLPIERQTRAIGATWLDQQLLKGSTQLPNTEFGTSIRQSLNDREEFLLEQGLARRSAAQLLLARNLLGTLREREIAAAATRIESTCHLLHHDRWR